MTSRLLARLPWARLLLPSHTSHTSHWGALGRLYCYVREMGLYSLGLAAAWYVVLPLLSRLAPSSPHAPISWALDLALPLGLGGGWAGSHVVACLGGCWLTWLLLWLAWLAWAARLCCMGAMREGRQAAHVLALALLVPAALGVAPFVVRQPCELLGA